MRETVYYVIPFTARCDALVGEAAIRVDDYVAAIGEAQRLAQDLAGAMAFARTHDDGGNDVEIIFKTGSVPDTVAGVID